MKPKKKKILVAIDESDQSFDVIRYISNIQFSQTPEIVLFHVITRVEQTFWDMGVGLVSIGRIVETAAWDVDRKKNAQELMSRAFDVMVQSGVPRDSIRVCIHHCCEGVARDIAKESLNGYDAVVVGRKGLSILRDMVLGSVAVKLIEKLSHVPVWVIGGTPEYGKILLPLDASEGAMAAVDYVGAMVGGSKTQVTLFHANRTLKASQHFLPRGLGADYEKQMLKEIDTEMNKTFDTAKGRLIGAGLDPLNISNKFSAGVSSRTAAIMAEAQMGDFGTIVMGRRGLSNVEDFLMGRVSNKILYLAKDRALWIVN